MSSSAEAPDSGLVEAIRLDGERPGVGLFAIQVMEALRRLGITELARPEHSSTNRVVTHAELRDAIDEVLAEADVSIVYTRRIRP